MSTALALTSALPWLVFPPIAMLRIARSRTLDDASPIAPDDPPLVSVVIPARDEERNIGRCVRSVLTTTYPAVEVIVVNDQSADATGRIAREIAAADPRARVVDSPPLPPGWFGKQWACATGAAESRGTLLLFIDADTWHAPDLLARAVNMLGARGADLLSVAGRQEMHSFWERVMQPQVFFMLLSRFGGTESVSRARRSKDVIASGQFLLVRREAYARVGGHEGVRGKVAEDLALAQEIHRTGGRVAMVLGGERLLTHMYASLGELLTGWGKNIFAGGVEAMPWGALGKVLFPVVLPLFPLMMLVPLIALVLAAAGVLGASWLLWAAICVAASLVWWALIYRGFELAPWWTITYPLGAAILLYIIVTAIGRGRRVTWKGRSYVSR